MEKKYQLVMDDVFTIGEGSHGRTLYRIQALEDFGDVKTGDLGGFIESENNLSHESVCWVYDNALVFGDASVLDLAQIRDCATVCGAALVYEGAVVRGSARVCDDAVIRGHAQVSGLSVISGHALVCNFTKVYGCSQIRDYALICDHACVDGSMVGGYATIMDHALLEDVLFVGDNAMIYDTAHVRGKAVIEGVANVSAKVVGDIRITSSDIYNDIRLYVRDESMSEETLVKKRTIAADRHLDVYEQYDRENGLRFEVHPNVLRIMFGGLMVERDKISDEWSVHEVITRKRTRLTETFEVTYEEFVSILYDHDIEITEKAAEMIDMVAGAFTAEQLRADIKEAE